jgi:hypothetical protein
MTLLNTEGVARGTLRFKIEQISDGALADMNEAVLAAEKGIQQLQEFEGSNSSGLIHASAARHVSDFETRWRPLLAHLEILKDIGDHISSVSLPSHTASCSRLCLGSPIRKAGLESAHVHPDGRSSWHGISYCANPLICTGSKKTG